MAGAGGEVICSIFHADRMRAGTSPRQTSEGRKGAVAESGRAKPWLHAVQLSTSSPRPGRKRVVKGMASQSDVATFKAWLHTKPPRSRAPSWTRAWVAWRSDRAKVQGGFRRQTARDVLKW